MNWDQYFFEIIKTIALKSKDRTTKVGCVVVGPNNEIRSAGYNGFPRGVNDNVDSRHERPAKYMWTTHSEANAVYAAARVGIPLQGCHIYLGWYPCDRCAVAIIQSGISEVVIDGCNYEEKERAWNERWRESVECAKEMLGEAGVVIRIFRGE